MGEERGYSTKTFVGLSFFAAVVVDMIKSQKLCFCFSAASAVRTVFRIYSGSESLSVRSLIKRVLATVFKSSVFDLFYSFSMIAICTKELITIGRESKSTKVIIEEASALELPLSVPVIVNVINGQKGTFCFSTILALTSVSSKQLQSMTCASFRFFRSFLAAKFRVFDRIVFPFLVCAKYVSGMPLSVGFHAGVTAGSILFPHRTAIDTQPCGLASQVHSSGCRDRFCSCHSAYYMQTSERLQLRAKGGENLNAKDRAALKRLAAKLKAVLDELDVMAEEVERYQFKKTTQRSPEWRGRANC